MLKERVMTGEVLDAYFAGIIDGEGTVTIKRQYLKHCTFGVNFQMTVRVGMVDKKVTEMLHDEFGGSLVYQKGSGPRCDTWAWSITSRKALAFLLRVRPYLRIKHEHADLAIEFQNMLCPGKGKPYRLTQEQFNLRDSFKTRITMLNRKPGRHRTPGKPTKSVNPATDNAVGNTEPTAAKAVGV